MVRAESSFLPFPPENDCSQEKLRKSDPRKERNRNNLPVRTGAEEYDFSTEGSDRCPYVMGIGLSITLK